MTTRVALVGCGFIGAFHSHVLRALGRAGLADVAVVATCDPDRGRAESFARAHGAEVVADAGEAVAASDAVYVCTPTAGHRAVVEEAARAGVAVFCEKPLATDLAGAEAMARAVADAGVAAQVGLVLRTAPAYSTVVDLVASGRLGRPMAAVLRDDQYFPVTGQYGSTWRADAAVAGGGTLLEHSIHDLDLLRWLLGEAEAVTARTANFAGHPGVEDVAVATVSYASGATAALTSVWHSVLSRPSTRHLEVLCQHGVVAAESEYAGPVSLTTDEGCRTVPCPPPAWTADLPVPEPWRPAVSVYAPQSLAFLESLATGRPPEPGLAVAVAAHRLADAVYRSAASEGSPVVLGAS